MSNNTKLTKKDLARFSFRYAMTAQACQSYEAMQALACVYSMGPFLERWYGDDPDLLREKMKAQLQFFNCQCYFGAAISVAALAIEETKAPNATELASSIKTSLMGPFAGIGDALFNTLPKVILSAMAAYAAIEGSWITGAVLVAIFTPLLFFVREMLIRMAYYQGSEIISERQGQLNNIREAISVLGIIVVGAMIASNVKVSTPLAITVGEATQTIQSILDSILPKLLSVITVALVYFGLKIKGMNTVRMVWVIILVAGILSFFGIVA